MEKQVLDSLNQILKQYLPGFGNIRNQTLHLWSLLTRLQNDLNLRKIPIKSKLIIKKESSSSDFMKTNNYDSHINVIFFPNSEETSDSILNQFNANVGTLTTTSGSQTCKSTNNVTLQEIDLDQDFYKSICKTFALLNPNHANHVQEAFDILEKKCTQLILDLKRNESSQ